MAAGVSVCTGSVSVGCSILPSDMKLYVAITLWPLKEALLLCILVSDWSLLLF